MTSRTCFRLQVRPDRIAEYRELHLAVWPDMLSALRDAGWQNYSLFLDDQLRAQVGADIAADTSH